jgi:hypothetical protein
MEDLELIRQMAEKKAAALDAFYERYKRTTFALVYRIVGNREDAKTFWWMFSGRLGSRPGVTSFPWQAPGRRDNRAGRAIDSVARMAVGGPRISKTAGDGAVSTDPFVQADT